MINITAQLTAKAFFKPEFFEKRIVVISTINNISSTSKIIKYYDNAPVSGAFDVLNTKYPDISIININDESGTAKIFFLQETNIIASFVVADAPTSIKNAANVILSNLS